LRHGVGHFGLTKSLAKELASRGVTVNAVAPGFVGTEMTDAMPEAAREATLATIPAGRIAEPDEIDRAATNSTARAISSGSAMRPAGMVARVASRAASEMTDAMPEAAREATLATIPAGRIAEPDEIARAVEFFAAEGSGYI